MDTKQGPAYYLELLVNKGLLVDEEDKEKLLYHIWRESSDGRIYTVINRQKIYIYRFLLNLTVGDGKLVDHIDGNVLNNKRTNLRVCDHSLNAINRHKGKGYSYDKTTGYYRVRLKIGGNIINIAQTKNEQKAKELAAEANERYHGSANHGNR